LRLWLEPLEDRNLLSFNGPTYFSTGSASHPTAVAVGDFNNDGVPDLVTGDFAAPNVHVLLGNGDGTFQAPLTIPDGADGTTYGLGPFSVAVADFNGDGNADIAVGNLTTSSSSVSILLGNGDGTFQAPLVYNVPYFPYGIAVGDFNGDGHPDLVTSTSAYSVNVLLGNGDGTFQPPYAVSAGANTQGVAVAKLTSSGHDDIVVANAMGNSVGVLLGNGDGTFQPVTNYYSGGSSPTAVAIGDFNNDGHADIAVTNQQDGRAAVLLGNGDGSFGFAQSFFAGLSPFGLGLSDFNGDGKLDMAIGFDNGAVFGVKVFFGNGDGTFSSSLSLPISSPSFGMTLGIGDFSGVGLDSIAVSATDSGAVAVYLNANDWGRAAPRAPVGILSEPGAPGGATARPGFGGEPALAASRVDRFYANLATNPGKDPLGREVPPLGAVPKQDAVAPPLRLDALDNLLDDALWKP
jgi:hypothetical protein